MKFLKCELQSDFEKEDNSAETVQLVLWHFSNLRSKVHCPSSALCTGPEGETDRAPAQAIPGAGGGQASVAVSVLSRAGEPAHFAGRALAEQHHKGQQGAAAPGCHPQTLDQVRSTSASELILCTERNR